MPQQCDTLLARAVLGCCRTDAAGTNHLRPERMRGLRSKVFWVSPFIMLPGIAGTNALSVMFALLHVFAYA